MGALVTGDIECGRAPLVMTMLNVMRRSSIIVSAEGVH